MPFASQSQGSASQRDLPRLAPRRLRRPITSFVLIAIAGWFLSTSNSHARATQADPSPITIGATAQIRSLDPAEVDDLATWEVLTQLYTGLTRQRAGTIQYEFALAEQHTVSADGLTHRYTIRADAAFADGTPITAQVFADSIKRVLRLNGAGASVIRPYVREATAESAVLILTLVKPIPYLDQLVALPPFFPVHPRGPAALITNGPYRVEQFEPSQQGRLVLRADPAWRGVAPLTAQIVIQRFEYAANLRDALKSGVVDLAWRGLPRDYQDDLLDNAPSPSTSSTPVKLYTAQGLQTFYAVFGLNQKPYDDPVVRRGISHLINREAGRESLQGEALPLRGYVPALLLPNAAEFPAFDLTQADAILTAGNYSRYNRVAVEGQLSRALYGDAYAGAVGSMLHDLGQNKTFTLGLANVLPSAFQDSIERGVFKLAFVGWTPLVPHPAAYLESLLASDGVLARSGNFAATPASAAIDGLLAQAALAAPEQAADLYRQATQIALAELPSIPLWQQQQTLLAKDEIDGILIEPNGVLRYDRLLRTR